MSRKIQDTYCVFPVTVCGFDIIFELQSQKKDTFGYALSAKIQISLRIRAVWSEPSLGAIRIAKDARFLHADNEDSDQAVRMSLCAHDRRYVFSRCRLFLSSLPILCK